MFQYQIQAFHREFFWRFYSEDSVQRAAPVLLKCFLLAVRLSMQLARAGENSHNRVTDLCLDGARRKTKTARLERV